MRERPILFSGPMVRALLDGTKTQTRRVAPITEFTIRPLGDDGVSWSVRFSKSVKGVVASHSGGKFSEEQTRHIIASQFCRHGTPGDRLWVRETWALVPATAYRRSAGVAQTVAGDDAAIYRASFDRSDSGIRWRPSIHMPRWASRITLEVTEVRVERLQDITETDARAEGCKSADFATGRECVLDATLGSYRLHFCDVWNTINGAGSWEANPWVWAISFRRLP